MLGENTAERKIREVIEREEIEPYTSGNTSADWPAIEKKVIAQYGPLGGETVYGAELLQFLDKQDWPSFGRYYARYFATAHTRSQYSPLGLAYKVFEHVTDRDALDAAIKAVKFVLDAAKTANPIDMDTYAGLLYKAGRKQEALQWQEKAVKLSESRDKELIANLQRIKSGQPTW